MNNKVSVIVPVYNGDSYIENSLKALLRQSYQNIEIIIINDGSTDNTEEILKRISMDNPNIIVINQENKGVSEARNAGIESATGQFIMFMDSDDDVYPDWVKESVEHIISDDAQIAVCGYDIKYRENGKIDSTSHLVDCNEDRIEFIDRIFRHRDILPAIWNKIYYTDIIKNNNIRFEKEYAIGEDLLFLLTYSLHIKKANIFSKRLYCYYINAEGAMQSHNSNKSFKESWLTEWKSVIQAEQLLKEHKVYAPSVKVKKVRIADKLISIMERYDYNTPFKKEMLSFLRKNAMATVMKKEFPIKKKISIILNCLSPKMKKILN